MGMKSCPDCRQRISRAAAACPHCGKNSRPSCQKCQRNDQSRFVRDMPGFSGDMGETWWCDRCGGHIDAVRVHMHYRQ